MKNKRFFKKIAAVLVAFTLYTGMASAQGYPVMDIESIMGGIQRLYTNYDMINNAIEQVKNTYEQIKNQIDAIKSIDWSNIGESFKNWDDSGGLKGAWNNIGQFRTNLTDATSALNSNLNRINDLKHTLENKTVMIGDKPVTVAGLVGIGKYAENNIFALPSSTTEYVRKNNKAAADAFAGKLSAEEKRAIMGKWGLDAENYYYLKTTEEVLREGTERLFTEGCEEACDKAIEEAAKSNKILLEVEAQTGDSQTAKQQTTNMLLADIKVGLAHLKNGIYQTGSYYAQKQLKEDTEKELHAKKEYAKKLREERERAEKASPYISTYD